MLGRGVEQPGAAQEKSQLRLQVVETRDCCFRTHGYDYVVAWSYWQYAQSFPQAAANSIARHRLADSFRNRVAASAPSETVRRRPHRQQAAAVVASVLEDAVEIGAKAQPSFARW
jgi:hypothetical protein